MSYAEQLERQGLRIGSLYALRVDNAFRFIPRSHVSYVGATETKRTGFLVLAILFAIGAVFVWRNRELQFSLLVSGADPRFVLAGLIAIAVLFLILYFATKRVGVLIASSGGRIFVEQRGKDRFDLLAKVHADLLDYYSLTEVESFLQVGADASSNRREPALR